MFVLTGCIIYDLILFTDLIIRNKILQPKNLVMKSSSHRKEKGYLKDWGNGSRASKLRERYKSLDDYINSVEQQIKKLNESVNKRVNDTNKRRITPEKPVMSNSMELFTKKKEKKKKVAADEPCPHAVYKETLIEDLNAIKAYFDEKNTHSISNSSPLSTISKDFSSSHSPHLDSTKGSGLSPAARGDISPSVEKTIPLRTSSDERTVDINERRNVNSSSEQHDLNNISMDSHKIDEKQFSRSLMIVDNYPSSSDSSPVFSNHSVENIDVFGDEKDVNLYSNNSEPIYGETYDNNVHILNEFTYEEDNDQKIKSTKLLNDLSSSSSSSSDMKIPVSLYGPNSKILDVENNSEDKENGTTPQKDRRNRLDPLAVNPTPKGKSTPKTPFIDDSDENDFMYRIQNPSYLMSKCLSNSSDSVSDDTLTKKEKIYIPCSDSEEEEDYEMYKQSPLKETDILSDPPSTSLNHESLTEANEKNSHHTADIVLDESFDFDAKNYIVFPGEDKSTSDEEEIVVVTDFRNNKFNI